MKTILTGLKRKIYYCIIYYKFKKQNFAPHKCKQIAENITNFYYPKT